ncbi:MAG: TonB-dependent receptor [Gemmatimonadaceae bacterium]
MANKTLVPLALVAALCFIARASAATAQEQEKPDSSAAARDSAGAQTLDPVRVDARTGRRYAPGYSRTGTKMPALPRDVPQSLVTISGQLVRDQAMQGLSDVVRLVPGATMGQGEGNRDQVTIRGNNSTADFFVDGVRDDAQYFRDLYNLERVEALKGSNAMVFGRGGGGGILNRVTKEANWRTRYEATAEGGTFGARRISTDIQQNISSRFAARLNSVHENSDLYRDAGFIERSGFNPTLTFGTRSRRTRVSLGYEFFDDKRTADRGIPSFMGKPVDTDPRTFFGNPEESRSAATVSNAQATISHDAGAVQVRNHTRFADYDKFYQNIFPGSVNANGTTVAISGYNNSTGRRNVFNQTDLNWNVRTGSVVHDILVGAEIGRQSSSSLRHTAYFDGDVTTVHVPVADPRLESGMTFRQSSADASNETRVTTSSVYIQDQVALAPWLRIIGGARYERFDLRFEDLRSDAVRRRDDTMFSPRAGLIVKPADVVSLYASYGVSFLPGSGDQFASLTEITAALEPERFANYEAGVKWDVLDRLALTAAAYQLDRTNTRAIDPADSRNLIQTGEQRSRGFEMGATGSATPRWHLAAGFARQSAKIVSATAASPAGATVPLVPSTSVSLWNRYDLTSRFAAALGAIHQSSMYAGIDNSVKLPAFERFDAAVYAGLGLGLSAQLNIENLFDTRYFPTAHSNNNITPGSPRSARLAITAAF